MERMQYEHSPMCRISNHNQDLYAADILKHLVLNAEGGEMLKCNRLIINIYDWYLLGIDSRLG